MNRLEGVPLVVEDCMIRTVGVTRLFKAGREEIRALDDVSIHVPAARLTMLRGRSGSGKTTLMNIMGALDRPSSDPFFSAMPRSPLPATGSGMNSGGRAWVSFFNRSR